MYLLFIVGSGTLLCLQVMPAPFACYHFQYISHLWKALLILLRFRRGKKTVESAKLCSSENIACYTHTDLWHTDDLISKQQSTSVLRYDRLLYPISIHLRFPSTEWLCSHRSKQTRLGSRVLLEMIPGTWCENTLRLLWELKTELHGARILLGFAPLKNLKKQNSHTQDQISICAACHSDLINKVYTD